MDLNNINNKFDGVIVEKKYYNTVLSHSEWLMIHDYFRIKARTFKDVFEDCLNLYGLNKYFYN